MLLQNKFYWSSSLHAVSDSQPISFLAAFSQIKTPAASNSLLARRATRRLVLGGVGPRQELEEAEGALEKPKSTVLTDGNETVAGHQRVVGRDLP
eukprot:2701349-Rhodomonas_salina.2